MNNTKVTEESVLTADDGLDKDSGKVENSVIPKNKKKLKRWQKFFLGFIIVICIILLSGMVAFGILRFRGERRLKVEEKYTMYNGEKYKYRGGIVNILCLGIDKYIPLQYVEEGRGNIGMSDTIMLVSIDTKKHTVKVIAIPRDTMAEVQTYTSDGEPGGKQKLQICRQYAYGLSPEQGSELAVDAVSKLFYDVPIQRYCSINSEAIPLLNDAVGGVDVEVLEDIEEWEPRLKYGEKIHLTGELAFRFINVRNKHIPEGTVLRTQRQKQYAFAFVDQAKVAIKKNPMLPVSMFSELQESGKLCTNITIEDMIYLMPEVMKVSFSGDTIEVLSGESRVEEDGFVGFHADVDALKGLIISTFYEKV